MTKSNHQIVANKGFYWVIAWVMGKLLTLKANNLLPLSIEYTLCLLYIIIIHEKIKFNI